jgi:hypothetical protein
MLFCDDAAGSHLGVVCYEPGCQGVPWTLSNRFWQEEPWAVDVTAFAWDPNGRCLYVSTSGIYGSGDVFALSLPERLSRKVTLPLDGKLVENGRYITTLTRIDTTRQALTYEVEYFDSANGPTVEQKSLPLPACVG